MADVRSIGDLKPDSQNARKHNPRNIGMIRQALGEVGAARSVVVDENNVVLCGNGVLEAAADAGIERVQVVDADGETIIAVRRSGLSEEAKRKLAYYDNRTAELAAWDVQQIAADLEQGLDLGSLFYDDELSAILESAADELLAGAAQQEAPEPQIDRAEELNKVWQVQPGDLWEIPSKTVKGKCHRLLCGDSTRKEDVERLMGGERADMVWTDPPYGVNYGEKMDAANQIAHRVRNIQNDDLPPAELEKFIRASLTLAAQVSARGAAIYVASPAGTPLPTLIRAFDGSGFEFRWHLVWLKDQMVLSRGDYHFKHENILYGWKPDGAHYFTDDRTQVSVFEVPRPKASAEHPTMKPPELIAMMVRNSSRRGAVVYDPFMGSGSTIIACEQTGRIGRGIDIEQKYAAVVLQRLADLGLEPRRVERQSPAEDSGAGEDSDAG